MLMALATLVNAVLHSSPPADWVETVENAPVPNAVFVPMTMRAALSFTAIPPLKVLLPLKVNARLFVSPVTLNPPVPETTPAKPKSQPPLNGIAIVTVPVTTTRLESVRLPPSLSATVMPLLR